MRIEHAFEYNADYYEVSDEFCANDSEYQAKVLNAIGTQFKIWAKDKTRTMTHVQILEIADQLNDDGKWFIETLSDYLKGVSVHIDEVNPKLFSKLSAREAKIRLEDMKNETDN